MTERVDDAGVELFTVVRPMNRHGAATVRREDGATYHVVEYASADARDRLADASRGASVRLDLRRAGARSNVWEAIRVLPGTTPVSASDGVSATGAD